jgi:hypothetical protein
LKTRQRYYEFDQMVKCRNPAGGAEICGAGTAAWAVEGMFISFE